MKNINKSKFHKEFSPEKRKLEANRIIAKYPSRIPAIVQISSSLLSQIYKENKDTDGFLYFYISGENVFGK